MKCTLTSNSKNLVHASLLLPGSIGVTPGGGVALGTTTGYLLLTEDRPEPKTGTMFHGSPTKYQGFGPAVTVLESGTTVTLTQD